MREEKPIMNVQQHSNFGNSSSLYAAAVDMTATANTAAATLSAAAMRAAAAPGTAATVRISAAVPATTADVVMGTAVRVKAVATTAAALREHSQLWLGEKKVVCQQGISS